jgi:chaperonin GroEL (HSP60 family)
VAAHDWLNGFGGFVGVVKWDGANVVVENMGFDDTVKKLTTDEAKFTIDCCCSSADIVP